MISRGKELEIPFAPGNWYGDVPPETAYHLEAQAGAISLAQRDGGLMEQTNYFVGMTIIKEMDVRWYVLSDGYGPGTRLCSIDCNGSIFEDMRFDTPLKFIETRKEMPEVFDGRNMKGVAAIFVGNEVLYKSPGFNLERYSSEGLLRSKPRGKELPKQNPFISALKRFSIFRKR